MTYENILDEKIFDEKLLVAKKSGENLSYTLLQRVHEGNRRFHDFHARNSRNELKVHTETKIFFVRFRRSLCQPSQGVQEFLLKKL